MGLFICSLAFVWQFSQLFIQYLKPFHSNKCILMSTRMYHFNNSSKDLNTFEYEPFVQPCTEFRIPFIYILLQINTEQMSPQHFYFYHHFLFDERLRFWNESWKFDDDFLPNKLINIFIRKKYSFNEKKISPLSQQGLQLLVSFHPSILRSFHSIYMCIYSVLSEGCDTSATVKTTQMNTFYIGPTEDENIYVAYYER